MVRRYSRWVNRLWKPSFKMHRPPYFPFADGRWRLHIGLTALDLPNWIEIDEQYGDYLAIKRQLLDERRVEVFASLPGSEAAQSEVLALLVEHLPLYFPEHFRKCGQQLENLSTGEAWNWQHSHHEPLELAARLVQEDLCLMRPGPEGYVLAAASVCFPSRWLLAEKIGLPLGQIHEAVPGYSAQLDRPVERFFERIKTDTPVSRLNWTIVDSPELFLLPGKIMHPVPIDSTNAGERLWIRVERQTLRRLSQSEYVLFTIRTYIYPLNILQSQPTLAGALAEAIEQIPESMQLYKSLSPVRKALSGYLASITSREKSECN